jgi:very-short-patch-repair endonuclease
MYRDAEQRNFARRLRNQMTGAEKRLWRLLRASQLDGHTFRRQAAIGPYIVDFVCFPEKLVIELDGPQHCEPDAAEHDGRHTTWLASRGFRVIRFWNHQLDEDVQLVAEAIGRALGEVESSVLHPLSPSLPAEGRGPEETR